MWEGVWEVVFQPGLFREMLVMVHVWWISSCALQSRETLDQRRADERAGGMQNQRASGAFSIPRLMLEFCSLWGGWGMLWRRGNPAQ